MKISPLIINFFISSTVLISTTVLASEDETGSSAGGNSLQQTNTFQTNRVADREQLAIEVLAIFGPQTPDNGRELALALQKASIDQLEAMREAPDIDAVRSILGGANTDLAQRVGDVDRDYSFTPGTPCRILDTRETGGKFAANEVRSYHVDGTTDISGQGGNASGCPSPVGEPHGVVVKLTALPTPGSTGTFSVYPANESAPAVGSIINYGLAKLDTVNEIKIVNTAPVKTFFDNTGPEEIKILNKFGTSHLVVDVLGYYSAPEVPTMGVEYAGGNQDIDLTTTPQTIRTIAVNLPTAGHCIINASGYFQFDTAGAAGLCSITTGNDVDGNHLIISDGDSIVDDEFDAWAGVRGYSQAAGNTTYRLVCEEASGNVAVKDTNLTAVCSANKY